jgi:hypothetical protein
MATDFVFGENIHETMSQSGTGPFTLDGAVTSALSVASQVPDGKKTVVAIWDDTDYEICEVTFAEGPPNDTITVDVVRYSTNNNNPINWPDTNPKNVSVVLSGSSAQDLFAPDNQGVGVIGRTAADTYEPYTLGNGPDGHVLWTNPAGGAGTPPTIDDSPLTTRFPRRDVAATIAAIWDYQAAELELSQLGSGLFEMKNGAEVFLDILESPAGNYRHRILTSGAMRRILTADASDLNFADDSTLLLGEDWSDWAPVSAFDTDTVAVTNLSSAVTIPSTGTWDIEVHGYVPCNGSKVATSRYVAFLDQDTGGGPSTVSAGANTAPSGGGSDTFIDVLLNWHVRGATNSTTYTYTVSEGAGSVNHDPMPASPRDTCHLFARAIRRA